ncbi:MAG: hypothetical protein HC837_10340 [Chloroflexaceae bacterium]|nr:hypothetical protein [Chloroflexaceae bacterium]
MRKKPKRSHHRVDMEEIRPDCFFVHNLQLYRLLQGEGTFRGTMFELTTWRRDGLLARLRNSGMVIATLTDQIDALPALPAARMPGQACPYAPGPRERFRFFDVQRLNWVALEVADGSDPPYLWMIDNQVVQRRRNRDGGSFYRVSGRGPDQLAELVALSQTQALLEGYAQATLRPRPPLTLESCGDETLLPVLPLPEPYRHVLSRLAQLETHHWRIATAHLNLGMQLYQRLGVQCMSRTRSL